MKGFIGVKYNQISLFTTDQRYIPVTVILIRPNYVIEQKTVVKNKYCAVKLGTVNKKSNLTNRSEIGRYKPLKIAVQKYEKELRNWNPNISPGKEISINSVFNVNDIVDVIGISKGKGTAGAIKRHNFACGPKSHGSHYHRRAGSLGSIVSNRVFKNKKNAGVMGHHKSTVKNLQIIAINETEQYILIKGLIPGPKQQVVYIQETKGKRKQGNNVILNNFLNEAKKSSVKSKPK